MPAGGEVFGVLVVRTEDVAAVVVAVDRVLCVGEVIDGGAATDLHIHSARHLFAAFFCGKALVIGQNARGAVGAERLARKIGRVTVYRFPVRMRRLDLFEHVLLRRQNAGEVHHLPQPEEERTGNFPLRLLAIQTGAARFEGRGRHAGRKLQADIERSRSAAIQTAERFHDVFRARDPADVDDLVRVGNDERRPPRNGERSPRFGGEHTALDMDMGVHKRGKGDPPLAVVFGFALIPLSDGDDPAVGDREFALFELRGENIVNSDVFDDQIGFFALHGAIDKMFHSASIIARRPLFFKRSPKIL